MKRGHILPVAVIALLAFSAPAQAQRLADAQIAAIFEATNQVDMDAGRIARTRAQSKDVREFGRDMFRDHRGLNRQARALMRKLDMRLQGSVRAKMLEQAGGDTVANLRRLTGPQFDRAYMDREVAFHQQVLESLDRELIPSTRNDELRTLLTNARSTVAAHLEHARSLQSTLPK